MPTTRDQILLLTLWSASTKRSLISSFHPKSSPRRAEVCLPMFLFLQIPSNHIFLIPLQTTDFPGKQLTSLSRVRGLWEQTYRTEEKSLLYYCCGYEDELGSFSAPFLSAPGALQHQMLPSAWQSSMERGEKALIKVRALAAINSLPTVFRIGQGLEKMDSTTTKCVLFYRKDSKSHAEDCREHSS